jgi:hypothetical protein
MNLCRRAHLNDPRSLRPGDIAGARESWRYRRRDDAAAKPYTPPFDQLRSDDVP